MIWRPSHRFDPRGCALADRHYTRQKIGSPQFMPPGSCRVLIAANAKAVFGLSYPKAEYVKHAWPGAWITSLFRNEDAGPLASDMIRDALAVMRTPSGTWSGEVPAIGVVTFVDPKKVPGVAVRGELVKGFCFMKAGFRCVGETKSGKLAWQLLPADMPAPRLLAAEVAAA